MLPAHEYLDNHNIPYKTGIFSPSTPKGAANVALTLGLKESQTVKTLIFETDKGELVLIMIGADKNVISGHLKKAVDSRNVSLSSPEKVLKATGYQIGSIPPFSWQPQGFRSFLDLELLDEVILAVGAGSWGNEILIAPSDLVKACSARVVNLTNREKEIFPPG